MSMKKELTMKVASEIFKLASKIGIKPRDVLGVGADVIKTGKSLFNTQINPEMSKFITKTGKIPTKVIENIKVHIRSLKKASDEELQLFNKNLKEIVNAKNSSSLPVASVEKTVISVKEPATSVKEQAAEAFKGWTPTVIKGGKEPFNSGGVAKLNSELNQLPEYYLPFADGGIANHFRKK